MRLNRGCLFTSCWIAREWATIIAVGRDPKAGRVVGKLTVKEREGFSSLLMGGGWHGKVVGRLTTNGHLM